MPEDRKEIGRLWINTSKSGTEYLSGTINDVKVVAFKNSKRPDKRDADWRVFESTQRQDGGNSGGTRASADDANPF